MRGVRRRGEGAARAVVRALAGKLVRLMDDATLSVSARLLLDAFFGVVDISNPESGSDSLFKSSQSWFSFSGRLYCAENRELLGPAVGMDALVPCDCRIGVDMNDGIASSVDLNDVTGVLGTWKRRSELATQAAITAAALTPFLMPCSQCSYSGTPNVN